MNSTLKLFAGDSLIMPRLKRVTKADICTGLEYAVVAAGTAADVSNDIGSMGLFGINFSIFTGSVATVSHTEKGVMEMEMIALGCADIPFDEIKEIMENKFNEMNRKLEQNNEVLLKVSNMVSKTLNIVEKIRIEMNKGFKQVVDAIENNNIRDKVDKIQNVVDYFQAESNRLRSLNQDSYIAKLEDKNGILSELKESRTPKADTLHSELNKIIRGNLAIPNDASDLKAFQALYALFYGTQTYVAIFAFLMEAQSYLANYYYEEGKYDMFNGQMNIINTNFKDFKSSIIGGNGNDGLLAQVKNVLDRVKNKNFNNNVKPAIYKQLEDRYEILVTLKKQIKRMNLPIIEDIPGKPSLKFKNNDIKTPFGGWKKGISVKYAVQYEKNGKYSKLSHWSDSHEIKSIACPYVNAATAIDGRNRLIFRQFDDDKPELVGILTGIKTEFRDIDRDLYNAAGEIETDIGLSEVTKILKHGANVNSVFEFGRTVLHNAAKSGNIDVMKLLFTNGFSDVNVEDKKGYTALHVAADSDNSDFIKALLEQDDVYLDNATIDKKYTPLHIAALKGYPKVVRVLARTDYIRINAEDKYGFTPLHLAANTSKDFIMNFFNNPDIDVQAKSKTGLTPAHLAAIQGNYEVIEALNTFYNVDINSVDINNMTPLHYATISGNSDLISSLIDNGSRWQDIKLNIKAKKTGWTPLHTAIFFKKKDVAIELIKKADIDAKAAENVTPLHMAAGTGQVDIVKKLSVTNADMDAKTTKGYTALHLAAIKNDKIVARELLGYGASIKPRSNDGKTPCDLAEKYGNTKMVKYLKANDGYRLRKSIRPEVSSTNISRNNLSEINFVSPLMNKRIEYKTAATYKNESPFKSLKLLGQRNDFNQFKRTPLQGVDGNGTLLLLDLVLRKMTKEKYNLASDLSLSEFEAQVKALTVTEKFEDMLNNLNYVPEGEQIDFLEVYSKVKNALMSGRGNSVAQILCSYSDMLSSLNNEDKIKLNEKIMSTDPLIFNFSKERNDNLIALISGICEA